MRFQSTQVRCGPAALREALRALGVERTEDELAGLARTTADGTTPRGLIRAITACYPQGQPRIFSERPDIALLRLVVCLRAGIPVILCVDEQEHWVAAVGMIGQDTVMVADPAHDELLLYYRPEPLMARWVYEKRCYSLQVA